MPNLSGWDWALTHKELQMHCEGLMAAVWVSCHFQAMPPA